MAHKVHDQRHKALLGAFYHLWATVDTEREVASQKQAIDLVVTPNSDPPGDPGLSLLHRMSAQGISMFELFYNTPGLGDIDACVRKQLVYHQSLILHAGREKRDPPEKPILWILSSGKPETVLAHYEARPMPGWPPGFWLTRSADALRLVAINQLPTTRDTLIVRLLGRGPTLRDAIDELYRLPDGCIEQRLAMPVLLDFPAHLPQTFFQEDDLDYLQQIHTRYDEWKQRAEQEGLRKGRRQGERRGKRQGKQELLLRLLAIRFSPLPEDVVEQIHRAKPRQLEIWAERVLTAESLEQVFWA